ncbi:MAG: hypothetical protein J5527_06620 [Treponema sp.]|nr:hypothetical protein [Treponema sp.]
MSSFKTAAFAILLGLPFLFSACKSRGGQPYATQKDNTWSANACGAFSMAYYLAETGQIKGNQVENTARQLYKEIKFDPQAGFGEYSDPFKIVKEITPYASSVRFGMNASNPQTDGEKLMALLATATGAYGMTEITDIASDLQKDEYVIEILVPNPYVNLQNPMRNPLHYVLTYWKGNTLYTLDPGRGKEEPRQSFIDGTLKKWSFCNSGIFIKAK